MSKKKLILKLFIIVAVISSAFVFSSCFTTMGLLACKRNCLESCNSCSTDELSGNAYGIYYTLSNNEQTYYVSEVGYEETRVVIPETYEGKPVVGIKSGAFTHYKSGVGCAGTRYYGMSLSSLTLPRTLEFIEVGVFGGDGYEDYYYESVGASCAEVYYEGTIEDWFNIDIKSSPFNLGTRFYIGGKSVTDVTVPENVKVVGANVFANLKTLKSVTFHEGVTEIGAKAFKNCVNLKTLNFPSPDLKLGEYAFLGCTAVSEITFNCENLVLYEGAFEDTASLKEVNWNAAQIESIPERAFANSGLEIFVIPSSVKSIGQNAFIGCYNMTEVYNLSTLNVVAGDVNYGYVAYYAGVVHTAEEDDSYILTVGDYKFAVSEAGCTLFKYTGEGGALLLPYDIEGVEKYDIRQETFAKNSLILSVNIPDCVTEVGVDAFLKCENLKIVTGCAGLLKISQGAFTGCVNLENVALGSVEEIGSNAFAGCASLKNLTLPASLTKIGISALPDGAEVKYAGTLEEWQTVELNANAYNSVTVTCSDGETWEGKI